MDISGDMRLGEWVLKGLSECVSKSRRVLSPLPPTLILKAQVKPPPFMLVPDLPLHPPPAPSVNIAPWLALLSLVVVCLI